MAKLPTAMSRGGGVAFGVTVENTKPVAATTAAKAAAAAATAARRSNWPTVTAAGRRFLVGARLHVGCGPKRIEGWLNTDAVPGVGPDGVVDLQDLKLAPSTFRVIYGSHVLEHCWPQDTPGILKALREALLPGGTLRLSVPDIRLVVANCVDNQVFGDETAALAVIYGGSFSRETSAPDLHRQTFWRERLERLLKEAGFVNVRVWGVGQYPEIDAIQDWSTWPRDASGKSSISLNLEADRPGTLPPVVTVRDDVSVDVSVILGTVNREGMLRECVASVRDSLRGSDLKHEIVVAYGAEDEPSLPWMKEQRDVVPVLGGKEGAIVAFNRAYEASCGRLIAQINDDILVDGDAIVLAVRHIDADPTCAGVAFKHDLLDGKGYHHSYFDDKALHPNEVVIRRSACEAVIERIGAFWGDAAHRTDKTYGGDSALGVMCYHLGLRLDSVEGVTCRDRHAVDQLRVKNQQVACDHSERWNALYLPILNARPVTPSETEWPNLYLPRPGAPPRRSPVPAGKPMRLLCLPLAVEAEPLVDLRRAFARIGPTVDVPWFGREAEMVAAARAHKPDLVWAQIQGDNWSSEMTRALREAVGPRCTLCLWNGDVRTSGAVPVERWLVERGNDFDLVLVSNTAYPRKLKIEEKVSADCGYVGCGIDPSLNHWNPLVAEDGGAVFLGTNYRYFDRGERENCFAAVQAALPGVLQVYGSGWEGSAVRAQPFVDQARAADVMRRAAVVVARSLFTDLPRYTSDRLKRAMSCGAVVAVQRFDDMEGLGLQPGYNCLAWSTTDELIDLLRDWTRPERARDRQSIRPRAADLGADRYTWDRIVEELLAVVRDHREKRGLA